MSCALLTSDSWWRGDTASNESRQAATYILATAMVTGGYCIVTTVRWLELY